MELQKPKAMENSPLYALLDAARDFDNDLEIPIDPSTLGDLIKKKVDGIWSYKKAIEARIAWLKKDRRESLKSMKALKSNLRGILDYAQFQLEDKGFTQLPGYRFRLCLHPNAEKLVPSKPVATADDFLAAPQFVEQVVTYQWNTEALERGVRDGDETAKKYARIVRTHHIRAEKNPKFDPKELEAADGE